MSWGVSTMKSKTSFFSRTLFFSQLRRFWPIFAAYLAAVVIALPVALNAQLSSVAQNGGDTQDMLMSGWYYVLSTPFFVGMVICLVFAVMFAMAAFSFLYSGRSVSMMCSLPYKRTGIFVSLFTPGLCGMLLSNLIAGAAAVAVSAAAGVSLAVPILQWVAAMCLMNLFFYGFAALCASLTGHILVLPAIYLILNFTFYVVEYVVRTLLETFVYGLSMTGAGVLTPLSPAMEIIQLGSVSEQYSTPGDTTSGLIGYSFNGWGPLLIYAAVGVLFALCAMLLIKHRRMEAAKDVVAIKPLKPVFKYCMTFGCALVIGLFVYYLVMGAYSTDSGLTTMLTTLSFMLIGAFVGYFGSEMLIRKSLKVFKGKAWIGFAVSVVIISGLMLGCEYDLFGYESYIPETSQIEDATISCNGQNAVFSSEEDIKAVQRLHESIISHKAENETVSSQDSSYSLYLTYQLRDGSYMARSYALRYPVTDDLKTAENLLNSASGLQSRIGLDFSVTPQNVISGDVSYSTRYDDVGSSLSYILTDVEAAELYNDCILPDMREGGIGLVTLTYDEDYYSSTYDCYINISFTDSPAAMLENGYIKGRRHLYVQPTVNSVRTLKWLSDHGIEPELMSDLGYASTSVVAVESVPAMG